MSFGKMNTMIDIVATEPIKDSEGFTIKENTVIALVRAYFEEQHGNASWKNRAVFSEATALFRFRILPSLKVTTKMIIFCNDRRFEITSVENVRNRGMYIEVLAKEIKPSGG